MDIWCACGQCGWTLAQGEVPGEALDGLAQQRLDALEQRRLVVPGGQGRGRANKDGDVCKVRDVGGVREAMGG
jgi:hypothetical protein